MAKHPVPKKKQSQSRSRNRYASYVHTISKTLLDDLQLTVCQKCGASRKMHYACPKCGMYRNRSTARPVAKKPVTKIKV